MDAFPLVLIVFSLQLLVIVSVAAVAEALGRVTDPRLSLAYWRGSPASRSRCRPSSCPRCPAPRPRFSSHPLTAPRPAGFGPFSRRPAASSGRCCAPALTADLQAIRSGIAPRAEALVSGEIAQPAGFGLRHPIVLLPESFFVMEPPAQRTIVCHELLHVARRDWSWIVVEEVARALFWFHPAVRWLVERIQQSREQLVDRLVLARIPSKRAYMAALLAFADGGPAMVATAFVRRRHLRSRLRKPAKESVMSRGRLVWTTVVLVCVMGGAIATTVVALPFGSPIGEAAARRQQIVDGKAAGVTLPKLVSEVKPKYTPEAMQARIEGTVVMSVVVRTDGTTGDIEVTRSLDARYGVDRQAVGALSQWRFEPGRKDGKPVPVRVSVEMQFRLKKSDR
jgi:TonB family protein